MPLRVIDSHTEGEPTRVVIEGGPDLGTGSLAERMRRFARDHDAIRRRLILEPRGTDAMVGALLCEPESPECDAAVIFFNNKGFLGMCGHGTIGVAVTLAYLGRIERGAINIETPVGIVTADIQTDQQVTVENVPSYRYRRAVTLDVPDVGRVTGDIAWGGNWFFLTQDTPCDIILDNESQLTRSALQIQRALADQGIHGADGQLIDHVEFFGPPHSAQADSRNFVLCPGGAYDRSPCGTGTSAKLACLADEGLLEPGQDWVQESVIGSRFVASYRRDEQDRLIPSITGRGFICGETTIVSQSGDPFINGIA